MGGGKRTVMSIIFINNGKKESRQFGWTANGEKKEKKEKDGVGKGNRPPFLVLTGLDLPY